MKISKATFGVLSHGETVDVYTLKAGDIQFTLSTYGATWLSLYLPSKRGLKDDVLLGFSTLTEYTHNPSYFGVTVGRFANRISHGRFTLNGSTYALYKNDGENTLHGGRRGFDKRVWKAEAYEEKGSVAIRFELESPDGEEGFPGTVKAVVTYTLNNNNEIHCDYKAKADVPTPINLTNHAYFNLKGEGCGDILSHEISLFSSHIVESDAHLIPTGNLIPVKDSPFNFLQRKPIGRDIAQVPGGYDHCYTVDGKLGKLRPCAEVYEPLTGRIMKVSTTQPGVQFYSGNFLNGEAGKSGSRYVKHAGFCLETQHYPDSPNRPEFPSCIFGPDRKYHEEAIFGFEW
uniref:Aldose 1-epimerase n=1 Tax=Gracilinema caldarium TaxID=215591 RepID=A0A7C3E676_9SPIR